VRPDGGSHPRQQEQQQPEAELGDWHAKGLEIHRGKRARHRFSSIASSARDAAWAARRADRNALAAGLCER
jgi:hypothetical protein